MNLHLSEMKPKLTRIQYHGVDCIFKFLQFTPSKNTRKLKCVLNGMDINPEEGFYICLNNFKLFPNVFLSNYIVENWGMETCASHLTREWEKIQEMKKSDLLSRWGLKILDEELENPKDFCDCSNP